MKPLQELATELGLGYGEMLPIGSKLAKLDYIKILERVKDVPQDVDTRVAIAAEIVEKAMAAGFEMHRLFVDPIVLPVKVPDAQQQPNNIIAAIGQIIYLSDPPPHIVVGLSNLSQGASERSLINRTFLVMAASHGLDAAIVDVLDEQLVDTLATGEMLLNKQLYSDSYLKAYRNA